MGTNRIVKSIILSKPARGGNLRLDARYARFRTDAE
jgi:hypothetical protein